MHVIDDEPLPIKVWGEGIDEGALDQARRLANLPFAFHHVAIMPDAHVGYGMPIGGVLATEGQVIPHAVGLDIGCGVRAWRTNVPAEEMREAREAVFGEVMRVVPTGFEWHHEGQYGRTDLFDDMPDIDILLTEAEKAARQVGTLGGGNHFIELQSDEEGIAWVMVHSGSRNVGKQVAEHYDRLAKAKNRSEGSPVPPAWGLVHLATDSPEGEEYLEAMRWCMRFAKENRRLMSETVQAAVDSVFPGVRPDEAIDVHHNYAAVEEHFGRRVVVHRKGAVRAEGTVLVPGSMGTASYVCEGLAHPDSFCSCSHGSGRRLGRKAAMRSIPRERVMASLAEKDIRLFKVKKGDLAEEAPEAYKDIEDVMRWQEDLVRPTIRLKPMAVLKG